MKRRPAVAGQFYHGTQAKLDHQVRQYVTKDLPREKALAILSPHAGLVYSGRVAGAVYSRIAIPETFLLLGPNHTGLGARLALMTSGEWEIPTGVVDIDEELAGRLLAGIPSLEGDAQAHLFEHSIEVQLPFITFFSKETKIVPLALMSATLEECAALGEGIARSIRESSSHIVIAATSDMSHYVSDAVARKQDRMAIDRIVDLDPEGLYRTVEKERITMCGYLPATVMLFASRALGAQEARIIQYATSAEVSGDYDHVVGYAGIVIL
ncbi:MAG TPA: AmmeMemoRadiSam system protein B [Thermodesulfovibrionales bacterium]|nr:AmmeMemoRadiSam system protein B [Thermodesulfovibrionales bacterium]